MSSLVDFKGAVVEAFERSRVFPDGSGGDDLAEVTLRLQDGRRFVLYGGWNNDGTADIAVDEVNA